MRSSCAAARDIHSWAAVNFAANRCCCDVCIGYKGASCARERARRSARQSFLRASKKLERRRGLHAIELEALMAPKKKQKRRAKKLPEHLIKDAPAGLDMTKQGLEAPRPFILTHTSSSSIILLRPCRRTPPFPKGRHSKEQAHLKEVYLASQQNAEEEDSDGPEPEAAGRAPEDDYELPGCENDNGAENQPAAVEEEPKRTEVLSERISDNKNWFGEDLLHFEALGLVKLVHCTSMDSSLLIGPHRLPRPGTAMHACYGVAIVKAVGSGNVQCQVQGAFDVVSQDAVQKMSDQELKYYLLYKGAGGRGNAKPKWWPEEYDRKIEALTKGGAILVRHSSKQPVLNL
ncbi:expressed protein [Aureococcus anophagefferens]|uniref:Expressed protein n=1 Tax=Aureococcus anophagefferens TaxID=44056 RepID=F0YGR2_AURAN|nr:expressed protein [Aureococcus anophagefferens]EGB05757.1 expressed protein [Aureococcus anophagefferens]|eukprot:XP_009039596.1 expressed protein [Aureococcus anophagefferens]